MSFCTECGGKLPDEARFCPHCGYATRGEDVLASSRADWLTLDDVINDRDLRLAGIGALLAFFGAMCPWGTVSIFGGASGTGASFAWLAVLASIAGGMFVFRQRSAAIVMVLGIVIGAAPILSLVTGGSGSSPTWGILLALAGGALMGYAGYRARLAEVP